MNKENLPNSAEDKDKFRVDKQEYIGGFVGRHVPYSWILKTVYGKERAHAESEILKQIVESGKAQNYDEAEKIYEQEKKEFRHNYYRELISPNGKKIIDLYFQKKNNTEATPTEEEKELILQNLEKAADYASIKLERFRQLLQEPEGKRYYHHAIMDYYRNYFDLKGKQQVSEYKKGVIDLVDSVFNDGLLSPNELEKMNKKARFGQQGAEYISTYDDSDGEYYLGYGAETDVLMNIVIDQQIKNITEVREAHPTKAMGNEFVIKDKVPPEYFLAVAVLSLPADNFKRDKFYPEIEKLKKKNFPMPYFAYPELIDELLFNMIEHPEKAFPIIANNQSSSALGAGPRPTNTESADIFTDPSVVYFGF